MSRALHLDAFDQPGENYFFKQAAKAGWLVTGEAPA
jgi:hypothetical protein